MIQGVLVRLWVGVVGVRAEDSALRLGRKQVASLKPLDRKPLNPKPLNT